MGFFIVVLQLWKHGNGLVVVVAIHLKLEIGQLESVYSALKIRSSSGCHLQALSIARNRNSYIKIHLLSIPAEIIKV